MRGPQAKLRFVSLVISTFVSRCAIDRKHCVAHMWKWQGKNGLNVLETQLCFHVVDDLTISNQWWSLRLNISCMFGWYPMSTINTFGHVLKLGTWNSFFSVPCCWFNTDEAFSKIRSSTQASTRAAQGELRRFGWRSWWYTYTAFVSAESPFMLMLNSWGGLIDWWATD